MSHPKSPEHAIFAKALEKVAPVYDTPRGYDEPFSASSSESEDSEETLEFEITEVSTTPSTNSVRLVTDFDGELGLSAFDQGRSEYRSAQFESCKTDYFLESLNPSEMKDVKRRISSSSYEPFHIASRQSQPESLSVMYEEFDCSFGSPEPSRKPQLLYVNDFPDIYTVTSLGFPDTPFDERSPTPCFTEVGSENSSAILVVKKQPPKFRQEPEISLESSLLCFSSSSSEHRLPLHLDFIQQSAGSTSDFIEIDRPPTPKPQPTISTVQPIKLPKVPPSLEVKPSPRFEAVVEEQPQPILKRASSEAEYVQIENCPIEDDDTKQMDLEDVPLEDPNTDLNFDIADLHVISCDIEIEPINETNTRKELFTTKKPNLKRTYLESQTLDSLVTSVNYNDGTLCKHKDRNLSDKSLAGFFSTVTDPVSGEERYEQQIFPKVLWPANGNKKAAEYVLTSLKNCVIHILSLTRGTSYTINTEQEHLFGTVMLASKEAIQLTIDGRQITLNQEESFKIAPYTQATIKNTSKRSLARIQLMRVSGP
mmetsp:Transcript_34062/g.59388  ORF Transcript_34062/g.59388 Transcript_34062/m.59388 type:complete len:538 (-) Transcript_34062:44-1657(-)